MKPSEDLRPDLVGDGYDPEPLWRAQRVAEVLDLPLKSVYDLPIPRVRIGPRCVRWRPADVRSFINARTSED